MAEKFCILGAALTAWAGMASAARPVAQWDVVPDQRFEGVFQAGVCAFHADGVKVEFRVGDKLLHTAGSPTLNTRTGVWEFWCALEAGRYPDGPVVLQARAIPLTAGQPSYDLPALTLYANSHGTLTVNTTNWVDAANGDDASPGTAVAPLRSLAAAVKRTPVGGTINLKAGTYSSQALGGGNDRPYWTTVQAAPGLARDAVEVGPGRPGTQRLRWRNVTLFCDYEGKYTTILTGEQGRHSVWLDDCKTYNKQGRWAAGAQTFGNRYVAYVTGGLTTELCNGPEGAVLVRNHTVETISSDAWSGGWKLVVNSVCRDINPGKTGAHPDFHQSYTVAPNWIENVILYNVRGTDCISQGLFGSRLRNSAFVNVLFEKGNTVMYSQYSGPMENVLFLHVTIANQAWLWRNGYEPTDVVMADSLVGSMQQLDQGEKPGLHLDHNHFIDPARTMGADVTTGDPCYLDPSAHDYHLRPDSPARGNGRALQCVPADIDGVPWAAKGCNRGCYANRTIRPQGP